MGIDHINPIKVIHPNKYTTIHNANVHSKLHTNISECYVTDGLLLGTAGRVTDFIKSQWQGTVSWF